ncbi:DUF2577 family protein [Exiguobacterium sp. MH3]|uniref:DUF2577 family protein n=1 Tax=Exiguobacterium sp. MH3 TaxID=1399115 RepID=UPI0003C3CB57|nr:DUF2577 family protein [Exiguobacterium sp. MH3]AHA31317.1 hypothetical protein U719_06745 [Exiguobacterium sp. MH3]
MKDPATRFSQLFLTPTTSQEHILIGTVVQVEPLVVNISGVGERDADAFVMDAHFFVKGELVILQAISDTGASGAQWVLQPVRQGGYVGARSSTDFMIDEKRVARADVFDTMVTAAGDNVLLMPIRNRTEKWMVVTKWRT